MAEDTKRLVREMGLLSAMAKNQAFVDGIATVMAGLTAAATELVRVHDISYDEAVDILLSKASIDQLGEQLHVQPAE